MTVYYGDCREGLRKLDNESVQCCITSPPYWGLRDYGVEGQLGLESSPKEYVAEMVDVFREVRRVLKNDGVCFVILGDSYAAGGSGRNDSGDKGKFGGPHISSKQRSAPAGFKPKDLVGIPWRVAFALQADGWYLRQDIIWHKPNAMPDGVRDRCTKAHDYVFLMSKSEKYYWNRGAIKEQVVSNRPSRNGFFEWDPKQNPKRNRRSVWTISCQSYSGAHFAVFPEPLVEPCILAGSRPADIVLDPFLGSGTVGVVAERLGRQWVGCELNRACAPLIEQRLGKQQYLEVG